MKRKWACPLCKGPIACEPLFAYPEYAAHCASWCNGLTVRNADGSKAVDGYIRMAGERR